MNRTVLVLAGLVGCSSTLVEVRDDAGAPVAGADVFLNGLRQGVTDSAGQFAFPSLLANGDLLFARHQVYEHPSYRPDHGPGGGWVERVYQTSRTVEDDGTITDLQVSNPVGSHVLTLDPHQSLIGWHLVVSLSWDASEAELDELVLRFENASQYLYNLTDGQFVLEQVDLLDDGQQWNSAEITFDVDNTIRPHTTFTGGFLGPVGLGAPIIAMAPMTYGGFGSSEPATIVHELGHLAFALADEYWGFNAFAQNYCTAASQGTTPPDQAPGGARAACAMDSQFDSSKFCSGHPDSAHRGGNAQPGPCWDTIDVMYRDPAPPGGTPRWSLSTPDTRGAVVGTLPQLVADWKPVVTKTNRVTHDLCAPFTFVDPAGVGGAGGRVWVRPSFWGHDFSLGVVGTTGELLASGVHLGDIIKTPTALVVVDASLCTIVQ